MIALQLRSTYSIRRALPKPDQLAARLKSLGYTGAVLSDYCNVSGVPAFLREMESAGLKAIAGVDLNITGESANCHEDNPVLGSLTLLARNQQGWKDLMRVVSASNHPTRFREGPQLSLEEAAELGTGNWLVVAGQPFSHLAQYLFQNPVRAYLASSREDAEPVPEWQRVLRDQLARYASLFGRENIYLASQRWGSQQSPAAVFLCEAVASSGFPVVPHIDAHYLQRADATDHRTVVAIRLKGTLLDVHEQVLKEPDSARFFQSSGYYLPSPSEWGAAHTQGELAALEDMSARCETPRFGGPPLMPRFTPPDNLSCDDYLKQLCREGWKRKLVPGWASLSESDRNQHKATYAERIKMELDVLLDAGLAPYFLLVWDYVKFAREGLKSKTGPRGSAAGCLVSYLVDIIDIDPVRYDLVFERFYNPSRKGSLPDIDVDFQPSARDKVVDYLRKTYGEDHVCHMCTFSRMQGRQALQDVLKVHAVVSREEVMRITKPVPDESLITDDLQEMKDEEGGSSIIRWALENRSEQLREWCYLDSRGELDGPLAIQFGQAIRLEGIRRQMGRHASGIIVSPVPVSDVVPLAYDKSEEMLMTGVDMVECEKAGLVKADILGSAGLEFFSVFERLIRTGK